MEVNATFYFNPDDENSVKYYEARAAWCNANNARIVEIGVVDVDVEEKYEEAVEVEKTVSEEVVDEETGERITVDKVVTAVEPQIKTRLVTKALRQFQIKAIPDPTPQELAERVREKRNAYLELYVDPIVSNPLRWNDLSQAEQEAYRNYRLYLLNIPEDPAFPNVDVQTFDKWRTAAE